MKYVDLHCDTLTACRDKGLKLNDCGLQTDLEKLKNSGCAAQCFAVFTDGGNAAESFGEYLGFYRGQSGAVLPVLSYSDLERCVNGNALGSVLTVENLGFIGGDLSLLGKLQAAGVRMASLVWNFKNALAYPNLKFMDGAPLFSDREERGLTELGAQAAEDLDALKIILDISHLSDGGAEQLLDNRKIPLVASHSNAAAVCPVCRNLTDALIKKIADCGGVVGVNFCVDFLGGDGGRDMLLKHINHIIKVGGEDIIALGSDFDGIPENPDIKDCTHMPGLFDFLNMRGIRAEVLEKLAHKNFARVFKEVCG